MYTHSYSFNTDILCLHIHSAECTVRLLNQAGRNNHPYNPKYVGNTGNLSVYQISSSTNRAILGKHNSVLILGRGRACGRVLNPIYIKENLDRGPREDYPARG